MAWEQVDGWYSIMGGVSFGTWQDKVLVDLIALAIVQLHEEAALDDLQMLSILSF